MSVSTKLKKNHKNVQPYYARMYILVIQKCTLLHYLIISALQTDIDHNSLSFKTCGNSGIAPL